MNAVSSSREGPVTGLAEVLPAASAPADSGRKPPDPFTLVIFGASGDLTRRKLLPAVYCLFREGRLPDDFQIIGFARRDKTEETFRDELRAGVEAFCRLQPVTRETWEPFARRLLYHRADFSDPEGFEQLRQRLPTLPAAGSSPPNCLFYLATQPRFFGPVVEQLHRAGLLQPSPPAWARVIVEKPFGHDLRSARELNARLKRFLSENQLFRIDHYLGKETVQNILVLRFANSLFEPLWNHKYVDHVQLTVAETVGMEGRGPYYDRSGALRDMVQNHMMHLLSLVAMEPPNTMEADAVRDEKVKVLKALRPLPAACLSPEVVRAQYVGGTVQGKKLPGYLEEPGVRADSRTETYVALRVWVENWRWAGVPFYLRTGKRLPERVTEIGVHFNRVPQVLFNTNPDAPLEPNVLTLRIQPDEGISLQFQVKAPGNDLRLCPLRMDFTHAEAFGDRPPEAYERLLLDAVLGDPTLFTRGDEVEAAWAFLDPLVGACDAPTAPPLPTYAAGTWGPAEADALLAADGRAWRLLRR